MKFTLPLPVLQALETRTFYSATSHADDAKPADTQTRPAPATNLAATVDGKKVTLTWTDNATNETGYQVYRMGAKGPALIGTLAANATTFTEAVAPVGNDVYVVRAFNAKGNSEGSPKVTVKVAEPVRVIAPNKLQAAALSTTAIKVTWAGDVGANAGYKVERRIGDGAWTAIGMTAMNVRTFTDTGLAAKQRVSYRVTAINTTGITATSATVIGQTKAIEKGEAEKK